MRDPKTPDEEKARVKWSASLIAELGSMKPAQAFERLRTSQHPRLGAALIERRPASTYACRVALDP